MHAFLFIGSGLAREAAILRKTKELGIQDTDRIPLTAGGSRITIDEVRSFQKRLILLPIASPMTAGIIPDASLLTIEAAQALLKILEEPPARAVILAGAATRDLLPETIVSRCLVASVTGEHADGQNAPAEILEKLLTTPVHLVLAALEQHCKTQGDAKQFTSDLLAAAHRMMISEVRQNTHQSDLPLTQTVRQLLEALPRLAVNCNPRLTLDRIFLRRFSNQ